MLAPNPNARTGFRTKDHKPIKKIQVVRVRRSDIDNLQENNMFSPRFQGGMLKDQNKKGSET